MVKIYHNQETDCFTDYKEIDAANLKLVAEVETDDLEWAFMKTNHIDSRWWYNMDVNCFDFKARSTSIGDVMELNGKFYVVAKVGFNPIEIKGVLV